MVRVQRSLTGRGDVHVVWTIGGLEIQPQHSLNLPWIICGARNLAECRAELISRRIAEQDVVERVQSLPSKL